METEISSMPVNVNSESPSTPRPRETVIVTASIPSGRPPSADVNRHHDYVPHWNIYSHARIRLEDFQKLTAGFAPKSVDTWQLWPSYTD
jgi:hypothetical protein